jgi:hypothetical protein
MADLAIASRHYSGAFFPDGAAGAGKAPNGRNRPPSGSAFKRGKYSRDGLPQRIGGNFRRRRKWWAVQGLNL